MQDYSSTVSYSPSFSFYVSGGLAAAAVKVSRESQIHNITDQHSVEVVDEDVDFEFETSPLHEETFVNFPTFTSDAVFRSQKKYNDVTSDNNGCRSTPASPLWSESKEFGNLPVNCLWTPLRSPTTGVAQTKVSKRGRLRNFLTRSRSNGAVSSPSESKPCFLKELMRRSHSDGSKTSSSPLPPVKGKKNKTASCNVGEGDKRRKSYLPFRQDLIGVFTGMRTLRYD